MKRNRRESPHQRSAQLRRQLSPVVYLRRHMQMAVGSLGRLFRNSLASFMTAAVIGIALALPTGLYLLLDNLGQLSNSWDGQASLSLFLQDSVSTKQAGRLAKRLTDWPEVDRVELITPDQALAEFGQQSGLGSALEALEENPLPAVLIITPADGQLTPDSAAALQEKLTALPETALAQLDLEWVQRLAAMLDIARRGILVIGSLLALAVLLVIGNTIRLEIQNRRDEIIVTKLIGATNGFVRRPFLYIGVWYGILGAGIAWLLVEAGLFLLNGPVTRLAGLYQSDFSLETLPLQLLGLLAGGGLLLGLLGSWLAVGKHLRAIEPR